MSKPIVVVTTVGTSILTNLARSAPDPAGTRRAITVNSNLKKQDDLSGDDDRQSIEWVLQRAEQGRTDWSPKKAAELSAELNGLIALAEREEVEPKEMYHYLFCTDTWLGGAAADTVEAWLKSNGAQVVCKMTIDGLRTDDLGSYRNGAASLIGEWEKEIRAGYLDDDKGRVIVNLTGGFKAVHGLMQTIATVDQCEAVYLFEGKGKLLSLPPLPVSLDFEGVAQTHGQLLRRLEIGIATDSDAEALPETYRWEIDGTWGLSEWGELVWNKVKPVWYRQGLLEPPSDRVDLGKDFRKEAEKRGKAARDRFLELNKRIDDLERIADGTDGKEQNLDSLRVRPWVRRKDEGLFLANAWSDRDARRLVVARSPEGGWVVRDLISHDEE